MKNMLALFGLLVIASNVLSADSTKPTLVEVWTGGDDSLTQGLRFELENKFKSSPDFVPSSGKKPRTLIVTIPAHVAWTKKGTRTHLRYRVEFSSSENVVFGKSSGSCWDDRLAECAAQIYRSAQKAADKVH